MLVTEPRWVFYFSFLHCKQGTKSYMKYRSYVKQQPHKDQNSSVMKNHHFLEILVTSRFQPRSALSQKAFVKGLIVPCPCVSLCLNRDIMALCLLLVKTPVVQQNYSKYLMTKTTNL